MKNAGNHLKAHRYMPVQSASGHRPGHTFFCKKYMFILLTILFVLPLTAQTDRIDSLLNDLIYNENDPLILPETKVKYDFFHTSLNYSNKSFYAGREINSSMSNVYGHIFYFHSSGFFAGVTGLWFEQLSPGYNSTTLTAGFIKAVDKKKHFYFRAAYNRFIYNTSDTVSEYPYNNNFGLGLSFRKNWFRTRVSGNVLFGDDYKINLSAAVYSRFTLLRPGKHTKIYTSPEVNAFFSTETVTTTGSAGQNADQTSTNTEEVYGLLNTQLYLPAGISLGDFDLEISYQVNFPVTQDILITYPVTSYVSFSVGYTLPIERR